MLSIEIFVDKGEKYSQKEKCEEFIENEREKRLPFWTFFCLHACIAILILSMSRASMLIIYQQVTTTQK